MDKNDIKLIAHVGAEVLIIGGLSFYFQSKLSKQAEKIENLEKHIAQLINSRDMHEEALKQLYGGASNNVLPKKQPLQPQKKKVDFSNKPQKKPVEEPLPEEEEPQEEEEEFDPDELDQELEDELVSPPQDDEEEEEDLKESKKGKKNGRK